MIPNRIDVLFTQKSSRILSVFFTAGFPEKNSTLPLIESLTLAGVDMIEVGIPFSDPLADGPVIQRCSEVSLDKGTTLKCILADLKSLRSITSVPVLLMGYLNSVLQYGLESFYKDCADAGIDGLILPDLSLEEYTQYHKPFSEHYNIHVVFLISPDTSPERIALIDQHSRGFIYLVASNATTGTQNGVSDKLDETVQHIKSMHLQHPLLMGFGIKGRTEFEKACSLVNGAIVGSAFIDLLETSHHYSNDIPSFIQHFTHP